MASVVWKNGGGERGGGPPPSDSHRPGERRKEEPLPPHVVPHPPLLRPRPLHTVVFFIPPAEEEEEEDNLGIVPFTVFTAYVQRRRMEEKKTCSHFCRCPARESHVPADLNPAAPLYRSVPMS